MGLCVFVYECIFVGSYVRERVRSLCVYAHMHGCMSVSAQWARVCVHVCACVCCACMLRNIAYTREAGARRVISRGAMHARTSNNRGGALISRPQQGADAGGASWHSLPGHQRQPALITIGEVYEMHGAQGKPLRPRMCTPCCSPLLAAHTQQSA